MRGYLGYGRLTRSQCFAQDETEKRVRIGMGCSRTGREDVWPPRIDLRSDVPGRYSGGKRRTGGQGDTGMAGGTPGAGEAATFLFYAGVGASRSREA